MSRITRSVLAVLSFTESVDVDHVMYGISAAALGVEDQYPSPNVLVAISAKPPFDLVPKRYKVLVVSVVVVKEDALVEGPFFMELPKNGDCATFVIANAENAFATTALNETVTSVDVVTFVPSSQDIKNKPRFDGVVVVFEMSTAEVQPPVLKVKEGAALLSAANITKTRVIVLAVTLMAEVHFREVVEVLLLLLLQQFLVAAQPD